MNSLTSTVTRPSVVLGALSAAVGFAFQGAEGAVLWSLVGYFLGKSIRSTLRTVTPDRTA
ncbi:MAG: hypothetical protein ABEI80_05725 [Haloplanus sp.]